MAEILQGEFVDNLQIGFFCSKGLYRSKFGCYNAIHNPSGNRKGVVEYLEVEDIMSVLLLYAVTTTAAVRDMVRGKISNRLILAGLLMALICRILQGGIRAILPYLGNIIFPVIVLYLFYLAGILGAGDIKLFSVIGGFITFQGLVRCMVLSFAAGALFAFLRMAASGTLRVRLVSGIRYLTDQLQGKFYTYEKVEGSTGNLMHLAPAIWLGLVLSRLI